MRRKLFAVAEVLGVGLVVSGVAMWSVPAAFVAAGSVVVAVCEVRG